jgi:hypothetical protein
VGRIQHLFGYHSTPERLFRVAQGDTGQSRIVANFLLAWWNAAECGGFDLTDVWSVDTAIAEDILQVPITTTDSTGAASRDGGQSGPLPSINLPKGGGAQS